MVTTTRRERSVLKIEEAAMNTTTISTELVDPHDIRESALIQRLIADLDELAPYVVPDPRALDILGHATMVAALLESIDRTENAAHQYLVGQSREISAWTVEQRPD